MPGRSDNPLLADWSTPFALPPFSDIRPEHFPEAFDVALAAHNDAIQAIGSDQSKATFANTIEALERADDLLKKVASVFFNLTGAHTNDELKAIQREIAPQLAAHWAQITANEALFRRVDDVYREREELGLSAEQLRLVERCHLSFVRSGAALEGHAKKRLGEIKERLASLGTKFTQNILADEADYELALHGADALAGLPEFLVEAARAAAMERGSEASHVITLSRSLIEPFLTFSSRRDLRQTAFEAWVRRGKTGGETDNLDIVKETLALRRERAALLGYENFAAFKLDDCMAKSSAAVAALLDEVWAPAQKRAREELAELQKAAAAEGINDPIKPWDWRYWAEKVRQQKYQIEEAELKAYFPLDSVIDAAFDTATRLFGLTFRELEPGLGYHPDVRGWDITDRTGRHVGVFLGDYFARSSKNSGAWMSNYRAQHALDGEVRPIIVNVMNFAKGADGKPALLSFDDARTLFHEFGHGLHGLLSEVTYPTLSGTSVARDFVELPSQLYEHWLEVDSVLAKFARHYETGDPIPTSLLEKLKAARTFNQGFMTVEYLASAIVDMAYHGPDYEPETADPIAFEASVLAKIGMPDEIVMRHATPHFAHVFAGDGYSAGYYSYLWSEVLDADAFGAFEEAGDPFHPDTAERLKENIYSAGNVRPAEEAYIGFRGRLPSTEALLEKRGLLEEAAPPGITS